MTDIQERLEHYEAQDRERQEREAEIMRYDLQLLAYARNHATLGDDYYRQYALRNAMIQDYGKTYGTKAQERLREMLDEAREKFQARAQELAETAGIEDRERRELEAKIKDYDLTMFAISKGENEPDKDKRFRAAYLQRCDLLRQYRRKYGLEAEEQLRDQLDEAYKVYVKQYEAQERMERQNGQIKELKQQLSEIDAVANAHAYALSDVKRLILDELYKFPAVDLLGVLLELQQREARKKGGKNENQSQ